MKQYNQQELDTKIQSFLTEKLQRYPELGAVPLRKSAIDESHHRRSPRDLFKLSSTLVTY